MFKELSKIIVKCTFTTRKNNNTYTDEIKFDFHSYYVGNINDLAPFVFDIFNNPKHVHVLILLPKTMTIAQLLSKIKMNASKWINIKEKGFHYPRYGFAAFSVSPLNIQFVRNYIINHYKLKHKIKLSDELWTLCRNNIVDFEAYYAGDK